MRSIEPGMTANRKRPLTLPRAKTGILALRKDSEPTMLRWTMLLLAGVFVAATSAEAAEDAAPAKPAENAMPAKPVDDAAAKSAAPAKAAAKPKSRTVSAARQLPPGLPHAGYRYRTTVAPATPYRDPVVYETDTDLLITPAYGPNGYTGICRARRSCRARRPSPATMAACFPMTIRAPITAARMKAITGACPTPAAPTAIASPRQARASPISRGHTPRRQPLEIDHRDASARRSPPPDATAPDRSAPD